MLCTGDMFFWFNVAIRKLSGSCIVSGFLTIIHRFTDKEDVSGVEHGRPLELQKWLVANFMKFSNVFKRLKKRVEADAKLD